MRKNNLLKKTAWIVLSAVLFGTVAGTVMTGIQIASSGMVSQFFAIVASDEDTVKAEGEALPPPEPFPLPAQPFTRLRITDTAGFSEAEASLMRCQAVVPGSSLVKMIRNC